MKKIIILVASVGKNVELANNLGKILKEYKAEYEIVNLIELNFPLFNTIEEKNGYPEGAVLLKNKMIESRGLIFVAPEYNGSLPPALNNSIAWIGRTSENWREAFNGKMAAICTHSGSGGINVLNAMRQQLSYLGVNVMGRQIHTHFKKALNSDSAKAVIEHLLEKCS